MPTSIQSAGVAPEVNLRNSWHTGDKARKRGINPGFETQGRHHQKSKTGVSVAPQKGLMSSKNFKKKKSSTKKQSLGNHSFKYDVFVNVHLNKKAFRSHVYQPCPSDCDTLMTMGLKPEQLSQAGLWPEGTGARGDQSGRCR